MIWNRGVVGRGVFFNHELERWKLQTGFSPKLGSKVLSQWQDSLVKKNDEEPMKNAGENCFFL